MGTIIRRVTLGDAGVIKASIDRVVMLHAYMFMQSGIPVLYSGDEIGQLNDDSYHSDPNKSEDSRYLHRGKMNWENAKRVEQDDTVENAIFTALAQLETIRAKEKAFSCAADTWTFDTGNRAVLGIGRFLNDEQLIGLFNFSDSQVEVNIEGNDCYENLISGKKKIISPIRISPQGFYWLKKQ